MGSTSRRDDGYSRALPPPDNTLSYSSRPSDQAQTSRPSRSGKSKGQSQNNNQSTDVPPQRPQQSLVAPPMQLPLSYSDYMKKLNAATDSGPGPSSNRMNEPKARPPENRTGAVTMAPPNSYHTTAGRNDKAGRESRDIELETRSRGGQVSPRVVVVLGFCVCDPHQQRSGQRPVDEDRRTAVAQSSRSAKPSGRPPSKDALPQSQPNAVQPHDKPSQYGNRGGHSNERHPSTPGHPEQDSRYEPHRPFQSEYHVQPFTGYIVSTTPVNLPIQSGDVRGHVQQPPPYEPRDSEALLAPEPHRPLMVRPPLVGPTI